MSYSATLSCSLLLLGISGLPSLSSASGLKLQRAHPLFGKCTASDLGEPMPISGTSFLQEVSNPHSDDDCLTFMTKESDSFLSELMAVTKEDDDETKSEETEPLTETASVVDIVTQAKNMLGAATTHHAHHSKNTVKKVVDLLKRSIGDSTLFVLGLGPDLFLFSKIAKEVIAVEFDDTRCQSFLNTDAGRCSLQSNVHIYCPQPSSLTKDADSQASMLDTANSTHGQALAEEKNLGTNMTELAGSSRISKLFEAFRVLIEDLVHHQFGDMPISALVVLGEYPVTKVLMMESFVDPSTVIIVRGRMPTEGLKALGSAFRTQASFEEGNSKSHSTKQTLLLQRLVNPEHTADFWKGYTASSWTLGEDGVLLQLVKDVEDDVLTAAGKAGSSTLILTVLGLYFETIRQAAKQSLDKDRADLTVVLESLQENLGENTVGDTLLGSVMKLAEKVARDMAGTSGLGAYAELLFGTLGQQNRESNMMAHALITKLLLGASNNVASANVMDTVKDGVEDVCELAVGQHPDLFVTGLQLLIEGLQGDTMSNVSPILKGLIKLGGNTDISALTQYKTG